MKKKPGEDLKEDFDRHARRALGITDDDSEVVFNVSVYSNDQYKTKTFEGAAELLDAMSEADL